MPSGKTPIRSRVKCPYCGGSLYYIKPRFWIFSRNKKRICMTPDCQFVDPRRFKIVLHGQT